MIEKLYTVEEVAELASVTTRTVRNYLKSGRLVGRKIGGQWRFTEEQVQQLLNGSATENDPYTLNVPQTPAVAPSATGKPDEEEEPHGDAPEGEPSSAVAEEEKETPTVLDGFVQPRQMATPQPPPETTAADGCEPPRPAPLPPVASPGHGQPAPPPPPEAPAASPPEQNRSSYQQPVTPQYTPQGYTPMAPVQVYGAPAFMVTSTKPVVPTANAQPQTQPQPQTQQLPSGKKSGQGRGNLSLQQLSDVGRRVAQFVSEVHDCSDGPQICTVVDLHQSLASAKITSERLADIAREESERGPACLCFVEFDNRYYIARYTLFGTSTFVSRCLILIG